MTVTLADAISQFGKDVFAKLNDPSAKGDPEDQLRGPFENLISTLNVLIGKPAEAVKAIGEVRLFDLMTRPDYAITRQGLIGFIELKAPGKGADPTGFPAKSSDRLQWDKLKSLPNLIYSDGNGFTLWRDGRKIKSAFVTGDVRTSGKALKCGPELLELFSAFYDWAPIAPKKPQALAETAARLCKLLRDQVTEQLARKEARLTGLKETWSKLLFPNANDAQFADGYAQAVTFGLLMARARDIPLTDDIAPAAKALRKTNTLIGAALAHFTEDPDEDHPLSTALRTMTRVLGAVDWHKVSKDDPDAWLYFYELFLQQYDVTLRRKTGSYYTPPEVVTAMVSLVDQALRSPARFNLARGVAAETITLADPAVGTGTFMLGLIRRIAATIDADEGEGSRPAAIAAALKRMVGFEMQFGPFAVAQLRLFAEIADLSTPGDDGSGKPQKPLADASDLRLYVTNTLADPDEEAAWIPVNLAGLGDSQKAANAVKRKEAITIVIGNPPYKEKAMGLGGWVENRGKALRAPLDDWQPPREWGVGAHAKHLRNLYVYFWRWATWKVFGGDPFLSGSDKAAAKWTEERGVICFITVAGFLNGPGFQKMRADLRRDAEEIFVIDCSPEGHQPAVSTRIFEGVQQPVCIVLALRRSPTKSDKPARVWHRSLTESHRAVKFVELNEIGLDEGWAEAPSEPRAPFLPAGDAAWVSYPALDDLFVYNGSGVMAGRTWVIAPDAKTLNDRWVRLRDEPVDTEKAELFHPHLRDGKPGDKHINKSVKEQLSGSPALTSAVASDNSEAIQPRRYAFRSFDRQWIIPDARLINQPNPTLWHTASDRQVYMTAPHDRTPTRGPALTISGLIPDLHHYNGRGGRVLPLWSDASATMPNLPPGLLPELAVHYGQAVSAPDVFAYIAAVAANPTYTERFRKELKQPGLRIPLTADRKLFEEAVSIGCEIVWLYSFGERFNEGRPAGPPRVNADEPRIPAKGALPGTLADMPRELDHDAATGRLKIGTGYIENVSAAVRGYEISGKNVLDQWWSYRREDRSKPPMGDRRPPSPLEKIRPEVWLPEYTTELLAVLRILTRLVALEPTQANLLSKIVDGPLLDSDSLSAAGSLSEASAEADDAPGLDDTLEALAEGHIGQHEVSG